MNALDIPDRQTAPGPTGTGSALAWPGSAPRTSRRRRGSGLRSQLVSNALLAAGLPILLTGGLAAFLLAGSPEIAATGPGAGREAPSEDAARAGSALPVAAAASRLDGFLAARIAEARTWASTPAVVEAARAADPGHTPEAPAGPGAGATGLLRAGGGPASEASNAGSFASALDRLGLGRDSLRSIVARIPDPGVLSAAIGDALADRRMQLALALGAIALLSALFAAMLANAAARRYAAAIRAVTEMAERSARGERARVAAVETPREIARLGDAVDRLARRCNRVREPRPVGGAHAR